MPNDEEIMQKLSSRNMYNSSDYCKFILRELNNYLGGDPEFELPQTIEHILPQNPSSAWKDKFKLRF